MSDIDAVASCLQPTQSGGRNATLPIYINSNHFLNRTVFGPDQESYNRKIESDVTAQYRLSTLVVEQSVFRLAEESVKENKLVWLSGAPVTSLREFIDEKTNQFSPKILKALMTK